MVQFTRPFLYPKQLDAMYCKERWGLIEASTKSGKTVSAMAWLVEKGLLGQKGHNYWWVSPGYNQSEIAFRRIKEGLTKGSFFATESPTPRITLLSGAMIWFKSGDNADALYGEDVYAAVIDEASRVREDSWHAIRSTLTATNGPARIIGNVKGRKNWFYLLARRAEAGTPNMHYSKITAMDAIAAGITKAEEVEDARNLLPENIFRELYYAEPSDDLGNPFGLAHIRACTIKGLASGPPVAWGIDLAKSQDYFVCIGLNEFGEVCNFERWQGVPWKVSIDRVQRMVGEDVPALVDSTGVGDPVLEQLQYEHSNFFGYHFTASSKQKLMEGLTVGIQSREISFPEGIIPLELENFEFVFTRTGVHYSAPEGQHDDCVCALALARQQWSQVAPGENIMGFYERLGVKQRETIMAEVDKEDTKPWRMEDQLKAAFDNELAEVYNEGVRKTGNYASENLCFHCNEPVLGGTRVSDGHNVWHPGCAGSGGSAYKKVKENA